MKNLVKIPHKWLYICFITAMTSSGATFADAGYKKQDINESYRSGRTFIKYEMYEDALERLQLADNEEPNNADINNLLGFAHRKLGNFEVAHRYYAKALRIDPRHRGANEYLGELYLQTGEPEKAQQQLVRLHKLCRARCKEYKKLRDAIAAYNKNEAQSRRAKLTE